MSDPLVSLVCPTFNRPQYLRHAVELLRAQTYKRVELIVVDDSPEAARIDLRGLKDVNHVRLADQLSLGEKHNIGNAMAQGEYIGFWDDDDWYGPRRIVRQLDPLVRGQADICGFRRNLVLSAGQPLKWWRISEAPRDPRSWIGNGSNKFRIPIHDGSAIFRRDLLMKGARFPHRTMNEKVDFLNGLVERGATWTVVPNDQLFIYVRHGKNTWQYKEGAVHVATAAPAWFPSKDAEFYQGAVL